jgi:hypothetical protein
MATTNSAVSIAEKMPAAIATITIVPTQVYRGRILISRR